MIEKLNNSKNVNSLKLLITVSLLFMVSTTYFIYMANWLKTGLAESYNSGKEYCQKEAAASYPMNSDASANPKVEETTMRFIIITLLFFLLSISITVTFLIKPLNRLGDEPLLKEKKLITDDFSDDDLSDDDLSDDDMNNDLDDDLMNQDLIIRDLDEKQIDFLEEEPPGILANSYNKMMDALQRVNELEKEHSIELAKANEQLQKEIRERKRAEKEIRYLSNRLISSQEQAKKELAQDIHDEFGQTLTALHLNAESLWNKMPDELNAQKKSIYDFIQLIEHLGDKIRSISSDLRPDLLDDLGLIPTLQWYIKEFTEKRDNIKVTFQAVGLRKRLASDVELVLYRIFQEGLNNVVKHSKAGEVNVTLTYSYPNIIFILKDNGVGFETTKGTDGIGLLGMRERVVSVEGTINITSGKNQGTMIRVEVPVSGKESAETET